MSSVIHERSSETTCRGDSSSIAHSEASRNASVQSAGTSDAQACSLLLLRMMLWEAGGDWVTRSIASLVSSVSSWSGARVVRLAAVEAYRD